MKPTTILISILSLFGGRASVWAQCQVQKLVPSDTEGGDAFGYAVAIDGDWAAVGEPYDSELFDGSGAVYVYHRVGDYWTQVQKLKADDSAFGDNLGEDVAISGGVIVVGAQFADPQGVFGAGAAYVFELVGSTWTQTAKLVASDAGSGEFFGGAVATTGDRIVVGATDDTQFGTSSGAAYIFDRVGPTWIEMSKLTGNDLNFTDTFGESVTLSGDFALVGAHNKEGPAGNSQGAAYLFRNTLGVWTQIQKLQASDGAADDHFGFRVLLSGAAAFVSTTSHEHVPNGHGAAYVFQDTGTNWTESQEIWPSDAATSHNFGTSLSLSGNHLLIGVDADIGNGDIFGSAHLFRLIGSTWTRVGRLLPRDGSVGDAFGLSAAISGSTAIGGAFGDDDACPDDIGCNSGSAYLFEITPTATQFGSCASGAPCSNGDKHGGCRNSSGQGAILAACGSGSAATDDLRIEATHCPPNKLTLLFMAPLQTAVAFGDGIRVVKQGNGIALYRLGAVSADAQGIVTRGPGLVAQSQGLPPPGHIQSGQTWNFQIWYRDSVSQGPCHTGTNFTNGVEVAFVP